MEQDVIIKPFDLEKALAGEPYGFRGLDKPVIIIAKASPVLSDGKELISQFEDKHGSRLITHWTDGRFLDNKESHLDLVMIESPEKESLACRIKARLLFISDVWIILNVLVKVGIVRDDTKSKNHALLDLITQAGVDGRRDPRSIGVFEEKTAKAIYSHLTLAGIPVSIENGGRK